MDSFEALKGIKKNKDMVGQNQENTLIKMLQAKEIMMEEAKRVLDKRNMFLRCLNMLEQDLMKGIEYDNKDLNNFVNVCSRHNKEPVDETSFNDYSMGYISAAFLELLNMRKKEKSQGCRVEIDLNGNRFNYLFQKAKNVDELVIRNAHGYDTCDSLGGNKGHVKTLALIDINDKFLASDIGFNGKVDNLILISNKSQLMVNYHMPSQEIGLLIAIGNNAISLCERDDNYPSRIENMVLVNNNIRQYKNIGEGSVIDNLIMGYNQIQQNYLDDQTLVRLIDYMKATKADSKKSRIVELALGIDKNNTEQMLAQVYKIREELGMIY